MKQLITILFTLAFSLSCANNDKAQQQTVPTADTINLSGIKELDYEYYASQIKPLIEKHLGYNFMLASFRHLPEYILSDELTFITNYIGSYLHEIGFFVIPVIQRRLKNLVGKRFDFFETCAVESPIEELTDNIIVIHGCMPHNCNTVNYDIYISYYDDVVGVVLKDSQTIRCYSDDGKVGSEFYAWLFKYVDYINFTSEVGITDTPTQLIISK